MSDVPSIFDPAAREAVVGRIRALPADAARGWGKMDLAQAFAHLTAGIEAATGERPVAQKLIGKVLGPFFRGKFVGPEPFMRNAPTAPEFVFTDARDVERERERLLAGIERLVALGPDAAARQRHGFLGRMTGHEWGVVTWKHLDHHLRQFGG